MAALQRTARVFKELHRPKQPLVLANVYDAVTARTVAKLPSCKALASASYAIAEANNKADHELDLDTNLRACEKIAAVAHELNKPLTVDLQDGYGDRLEEGVSRLVEMGVVGINLEDYDNTTSHKMYSKDVAAARVKRALSAAAQAGVQDFVVNARCDAFLHGGDLKEVISRGNAYLEAGATTVFVWGLTRGVSRQEVEALVEAFEGRLNVKFKEDGLSIKQLASIGVARVSVGPALQRKAMELYANEAYKLLSQV